MCFLQFCYHYMCIYNANYTNSNTNFRVLTYVIYELSFFFIERCLKLPHQIMISTNEKMTTQLHMNKYSKVEIIIVSLALICMCI